MFQSVENLVKNFLISFEFDWSLVNLPVILVTAIVALISTYVIWRNYKKRKPNSILKKNVRIVEEEKKESAKCPVATGKGLKTTMMSANSTTTMTRRHHMELPRLAVGAEAPQCPFQALFNDIKRTRAAAEAAEAEAASAREEQNRDFLDSQLERDKIIEEQLIDYTRPDDDMFLLHQLEKIEMSKEEREKELELKKAQLQAIFDLLKKQEQEQRAALNPGGDEAAGEVAAAANNDNNANSNEFEFSVLKEDGTYEKKEIELKKDFESQLRLYGL